MADDDIAGSSKRTSDDGEDTDRDSRRSKKHRTNNVHADVRLLVPSKNAGAIIGRGGENIKKLRRDFNANIGVPDSRGPERVVTMSANIDDIREIMSDIIPTLERVEDKTEDIDADLRMLVHQSFAGRVIGKGGVKVKELKEETGASIKVYTECCPCSTERVVQLTGKKSQVVACAAMILDLLDGATIKGMTMPYDAGNFDDTYADAYGGYCFDGGRRGGGGGGRGPPMRGGDGMGGDRNWGRSGGAMGGYGMGGGGGYGMGGYDGGMGGYGGGGMGGYGGGGMMGGGQTTQQVSIPKQLAGAIIGKGGSRIKQVQQESGTMIKMDEATSDSSERIISITGSHEQIQYAQYLLQMTVKQHANF